MAEKWGAGKGKMFMVKKSEKVMNQLSGGASIESTGASGADRAMMMTTLEQALAIIQSQTGRWFEGVMIHIRSSCSGKWESDGQFVGQPANTLSVFPLRL